MLFPLVACCIGVRTDAREFALHKYCGRRQAEGDVFGRLQRCLCETYDTCECGSPTAFRTPAREYAASPAVVQKPSRSSRHIAQELGLFQLQVLKCLRISCVNTTVRGTLICCPTIVHCTPCASKFEAFVIRLIPCEIRW